MCFSDPNMLVGRRTMYQNKRCRRVLASEEELLLVSEEELPLASEEELSKLPPEFAPITDESSRYQIYHD